MNPSHIGRYEILSEIGRGGMGIVFLAYDPQIDRQIAIKLLPSHFLSEKKYQARFSREARIIARLEHPAIVPIYDYGHEGEQPYLVMRYMAGGSLAEWLRNGRLPMRTAVAITTRIASALHEAHQNGIIHRDIKPSNILLDARGETYLSDFGIVKVAESTNQLTGSTIVGTPAYMSPEQIKNKELLDHRADIYALGVVLFEMLTGKRPFPGETYPEQILAHTTEPVPNVCDFNPDLPPAFEDIIRKTMAKQPETRYGSVDELVSQLDKIINSKEVSIAQSLPNTPSTLPNFPKTKTFAPRSLIALGLVFLLIVAFIVAPRFLPPVSGNTPTSSVSTSYSIPATNILPTVNLPEPETAVATHTPPALQTDLFKDQALNFQIISIQENSYAVNPEANLGLAPGETTLLGIPFEHGWKVSTQCANSQARAETIEVQVDDLLVSKIHILLQGGQGLIRFNEQKIGEIALNFVSGETFEEPLILGHNIRDWRRDQSELYVDSSTAFNLREAWTARAGNTNGRIDLLSLTLPAPLQTTPLSSIRLTDTSNQTTGSMDPCIHLLAITAESHIEP